MVSLFQALNIFLVPIEKFTAFSKCEAGSIKLHGHLTGFIRFGPWTFEISRPCYLNDRPLSKNPYKGYLWTSFAKIFLFILVDGVYRRFQNRFLNLFLSNFKASLNLLFLKLVFLFALLKDNFVQSPAQVQYWLKDFCILISAAAILPLGHHPKVKLGHFGKRVHTDSGYTMIHIECSIWPIL